MISRLVGPARKPELAQITLPPRSPLTPREEEIAAFAAAGVSDKDIAERLSLSVRTIHAHLRSVYAKLSVTSRHDLRSFFGTGGLA